MIDRVMTYYENYDEDGRLFRDKAHLPEYLTTIRYFDRLFAPGSKILDACAGTGRYSFYLADKGHRMTACDLVEHNVNLIKSKPGAARLEGVFAHNALEAFPFEENSFDAVLCMGAMYHLPSGGEKTLAIRNCAAVCKPRGLVALSYLNYFAVVPAEAGTGLVNFEEALAAFEDGSDNLWKATTPGKMEGFAKSAGLEILHNIGADGMSFIMADKVNAASDEVFDKWMEYIYRHCEEPSILGCSMHGLLICKKS